MEQLTTTHKVKQALIILSKSMPADKISVKHLIEFAGISRATFYKYFVNLTRVWHEITHDLLHEMAALKIDPTASFFSDYSHLDQLAAYIYHRKEIIKMLVSQDGDPLFLVKWEQQMKENILERMQKDGSYSYTKQEQMAKFLACGAANTILEAIHEDNRMKILAALISIEDVLVSFSLNKSDIDKNYKII